MYSISHQQRTTPPWKSSSRPICAEQRKNDLGRVVSRILSAPVARRRGSFIYCDLTRSPDRFRSRDGPSQGPLFGLAPNGVYRAASLTLGAVGSYPTFSPLPGEPGGLFSAALAVGDALKRRLPRVSRPQGAGYAASRPAEFGLSSPGKPEATLRPPGIEEPVQATVSSPRKQAAWPSVIDIGQICHTRGTAIRSITIIYFILWQ